MFDIKRVEREIGGETLSIETGKIAKQAAGAVITQYGDTVVLTTVCMGDAREGQDFFPLTVEYQEKTYAAGKIPGGFFKREGRPTMKEILTCRLTDRPIRPLFPENFLNELQVVSTVLSSDGENDSDVLSMVGASAALSISNVPFEGPTGSVRVGKINGELVLNPTFAQLEDATIEVIVSGTKDAVCMVEAGAQEESEAALLEAIYFGHEAIKTICEMVNELADLVGRKEKFQAPKDESFDKFYPSFKDEYFERVYAANQAGNGEAAGKFTRTDAIKAVKKEAKAKYLNGEEGAIDKGTLSKVFEELEVAAVRKQILTEGKRADGRGLTDIRPIESEAGLLPRTHGSALFTRGETQGLVICTLGNDRDAQFIDGLQDTVKKRFLMHYNFPPFSVGEARRMGTPGRREIGHGFLAERAVKAILPDFDEFPYTIRIVSEITESNGSSSMATVCGASLALMDCGVPIKAPVAGIAMGLVQEGEQSAILSDILGSEDHCGDMDFKVAGTAKGITALQMDIKITGISKEVMENALSQALVGRQHILSKITDGLEAPRTDINEWAPKMGIIQIPVSKIGAVVGPGGKIIKAIQEKTGVDLSIDDEGNVQISGMDAEAIEAAKTWVEGLVAEVEIGKVYTGKVTGVKNFGCFVELIPGKEGMCHVSEFSNDFIKDMEDVVQEGDEVTVKVLAVDPSGRVKLSRKATLEPVESGDTSE